MGDSENRLILAMGLGCHSISNRCWVYCYFYSLWQAARITNQEALIKNEVAIKSYEGALVHRLDYGMAENRRLLRRTYGFRWSLIRQ